MATVEFIREDLQKEFASLKISKKPALQIHVKANCALSMKRLEKKPPAKRKA